MKTITAYINARKSSSRCKNKLLRPFAGTTLFDISIQKIKTLQVDSKVVCSYEDDFLDIAIKNNIPIFRRSYESAHCDLPLKKVFESYYSFDTDYVMFINPCHAHLKSETIQNAIDRFREIDAESMTSVQCIRDWIFSDNGLMVIPTSFNGDTKTTSKYYRVAHAFHIYNRHRFLKDETVWLAGPNDPYLFEISKIESIDVDDEEDFLISESLYSSQQH